MNTGQVMLILGAFAVLSVLSLSLNRTMFGSSQLGYELEATLNALSIGQSMLDEIMTQSFDQKTAAGKVVNSYSEMTPPDSLGPDSGEAITGIDSAYWSGGAFYDFKSKSRFNDVDDYRLYRRRVFDPRMGYFDVLDSIHYVSETKPSRDTTSATYYKKIVVVVTHPSLPKAKDTDTTVAPIVVRDIAVYRRYF